MKFVLIIFVMMYSHFSFGQISTSQNELPAGVQKNRPVEVKATPEISAKNSTEKLTTSLKLNAKQKNDLHVALLDYETNLMKIDKSKATKKEKFTKKKVLYKERQTRLKSIFTKQQFNDYLLSFP